jgi:hypothetical protein
VNFQGIYLNFKAWDFTIVNIKETNQLIFNQISTQTSNILSMNHKLGEYTGNKGRIHLFSSEPVEIPLHPSLKQCYGIFKRHLKIHDKINSKAADSYPENCKKEKAAPDRSFNTEVPQTPLL